MFKPEDFVETAPDEHVLRQDGFILKVQFQTTLSSYVLSADIENPRIFIWYTGHTGDLASGKEILCRRVNNLVDAISQTILNKSANNGPTKIVNQCTCDIMVLMSNGCKCGHLAKSK